MTKRHIKLSFMTYSKISEKIKKPLQKITWKTRAFATLALFLTTVFILNSFRLLAHIPLFERRFQ